MKIQVCKGCGGYMEARHQDGRPACVTCIGLKPDSGIPVEVEIDVKDITCCYCGSPYVEGSFTHPPFFQYRPGGKHTFYCGCRGWD